MKAYRVIDCKEVIKDGAGDTTLLGKGKAFYTIAYENRLSITEYWEYVTRANICPRGQG